MTSRVLILASALFGSAMATPDPCAACATAAPCFEASACAFLSDGVWSGPFAQCTTEGAANCAACYPGACEPAATEAPATTEAPALPEGQFTCALMTDVLQFVDVPCSTYCLTAHYVNSRAQGLGLNFPVCVAFGCAELDADGAIVNNMTAHEELAVGDISLFGCNENSDAALVAPEGACNQYTSFLPTGQTCSQLPAELKDAEGNTLYSTAPATEAPATEAPATEAPASEEEDNDWKEDFKDFFKEDVKTFFKEDAKEWLEDDDLVEGTDNYVFVAAGAGVLVVAVAGIIIAVKAKKKNAALASKDSAAVAEVEDEQV